MAHTTPLQVRYILIVSVHSYDIYNNFPGRDFENSRTLGNSSTRLLSRFRRRASGVCASAEYGRARAASKTSDSRAVASWHQARTLRGSYARRATLASYPGHTYRPSPCAGNIALLGPVAALPPRRQGIVTSHLFGRTYAC